MRDGGRDFRSGDTIDVQAYFVDRVDIHHIFPRAWCQKHGIEARYYDSIVNKTPLSSKTNRIIGGNAPSVYLKKLRDDTGMTETRQDEILASHVIDIDALKSDDFSAFFESRKEALLVRIEAATGKKIVREEQDEAALLEANGVIEDSEEEDENV